MNQKTAKLIRKFVKKNFAAKSASEQKRIGKRVRNTYQKQTDTERRKLKRDMELTLIGGL